MGLEVNVFSTIICTLIFGAGIDFNIFLTHGLQKKLTTGEDELPTFRIAIILALITTILAIGTLVFAKHPALYSPSVVAIVGMSSVVLTSFTLYPLLFGWLTKRSERGFSPVNLLILFRSIASLVYYSLICVLFSLFTPLFIKTLKGKKPENFKKLIANPQENFSRSSIIIANHSSSLDTLALALATHKIVYLVNDWVYHSPILED